MHVNSLRSSDVDVRAVDVIKTQVEKCCLRVRVDATGHEFKDRDPIIQRTMTLFRSGQT